MSLKNFNYAIPWSKFRKLRARPQGTDADAETTAAYNSKNIRLGRKNRAVVIVSADVNISIITSNSWVVTNQMKDYLLKHEQGHYDITALAAREFHRELFKLTATDTDALNTSMERLNSILQQKMDSANIRYDLQTDHSRDKAVQENWNRKIAAEKQKPDGSIDNLPQ